MRKTVIAGMFDNTNFICGPQHDNQIAKPCKSVEDAIKNLQNIIDIQCSTGNWNYCAYMQGLANGLIMSMSILDGKDPKFMDPPKDGWIEDRPKSKTKNKLEVVKTVTATASIDSDRHKAMVVLNRINSALAADPISVKAAFNRLCLAMKEDPDYAWGWHCNIAMTAFDAGATHDKANEWTANFMKYCFGVDTLTRVREEQTGQAIASASDDIDTPGKAYNVFKRFGITGFKTPKISSGKGKQIVKSCSIRSKSGQVFWLSMKTLKGDLKYELRKPGEENYTSVTVVKATKNLRKFIEDLTKVRGLSEYHSTMKEYLDAEDHD